MYERTLDKRRLAILLVTFAVVIFSALYYFGLIKLPNIKVSSILQKEKTQQELLSDFKSDLVAGKLTNLIGTVVKVSGKVVTLTTSTNGSKTEQNVTLADSVVIRRLTNPAEHKPGDGLVPMVETFITIQDLQVGDTVFANLNKEGAVVVLDVMPSLANTTSVVNGVGTTTGNTSAK
ncbi:MAG: hypothetical protein WAW90_01050 [Minisyncoccia bacterium]